MLKKIKLPRKRKKAYIKAKGAAQYLGMRLVNETLGKHTFPVYKEVHGNMKAIKNW